MRVDLRAESWDEEAITTLSGRAAYLADCARGPDDYRADRSTRVLNSSVKPAPGEAKCVARSPVH